MSSVWKVRPRNVPHARATPAGITRSTPISSRTTAYSNRCFIRWLRTGESLEEPCAEAIRRLDADDERHRRDWQIGEIASAQPHSVFFRRQHNRGGSGPGRVPDPADVASGKPVMIGKRHDTGDVPPGRDNIRGEALWPRDAAHHEDPRRGRHDNRVPWSRDH